MGVIIKCDIIGTSASNCNSSSDDYNRDGIDGNDCDGNLGGYDNNDGYS